MNIEDLIDYIEKDYFLEPILQNCETCKWSKDPKTICYYEKVHYEKCIEGRGWELDDSGRVDRL